MQTLWGPRDAPTWEVGRLTAAGVPLRVEARLAPAGLARGEALPPELQAALRAHAPWRPFLRLETIVGNRGPSIMRRTRWRGFQRGQNCCRVSG